MERGCPQPASHLPGARRAWECTPYAEEGRSFEPDYLGPCFGKINLGLPGVSHQQILGTAQEGNAKAFPWDLTSRDLPTLFRRRVDPGVCSRSPHLWPNLSPQPGLGTDPREPGPQEDWMQNQQGTWKGCLLPSTFSHQALLTCCCIGPALAYQASSLG